MFRVFFLLILSALSGQISAYSGNTSALIYGYDENWCVYFTPNAGYDCSISGYERQYQCVLPNL
jgi:hypothetical protein